jgi:hypothetical protein
MSRAIANSFADVCMRAHIVVVALSHTYTYKHTNTQVLKKQTNCNPFLVMRYLHHLNRCSPPMLYFDEIASRWQARLLCRSLRCRCDHACATGVARCCATRGRARSC